MPRLLIVDDDLATCAAISSFLTGSWEVIARRDGTDLEEVVRKSLPDVILLDINLPGPNGLKLLASIKPLAETIPVLMISIRGEDQDMLTAFDLGAIDYVTKPFSLKVLKARLERFQSLSGKKPSTINIGQSIIDFGSACIESNGRREKMTQKETLILRYLLSNRGLILSRQQILDYAWGYDYEGTHRTVDNVIASLRKKIGDSDESPVIKSHRGMGYSLEG